VIEVSGVGYAPRGAFTATGREVDSSELADIARAALLCNDAILRETDGEWQLEGDPTEGALLALAIKARAGCALRGRVPAAHRCHPLRIRALRKQHPDYYR